MLSSQVLSIKDIKKITDKIDEKNKNNMETPKKDLAFIYMYYYYCNGEHFAGAWLFNDYKGFMSSVYRQSRMYKEMWELKPSLKLTHLKKLLKKYRGDTIITKKFLKEEIGKTVC